MPDRHSIHSTLRERIVEHAFVGDSLRALWSRGVVDVEVLRSEFDAHGYDLVMERGKIVRHIQLKTGQSKRPERVSVALALGEKPSGCVIWIKVTDNLDMGPFFWFGAAPGEPLPALGEFEVPKRATHNKAGVRPPRSRHRLIPKGGFRELADLNAVLEALFGSLSQ